MVQLFVIRTQRCKKIEKALSCARMLMQSEVAVHVETVVLLQRKDM